MIEYSLRSPQWTPSSGIPSQTHLNSCRLVYPIVGLAVQRGTWPGPRRHFLRPFVASEETSSKLNLDFGFKVRSREDESHIVDRDQFVWLTSGNRLRSSLLLRLVSQVPVLVEGSRRAEDSSFPLPECGSQSCGSLSATLSTRNAFDQVIKAMQYLGHLFHHGWVSRTSRRNGSSSPSLL
jgi:hypothetical protein